MKDKEVRNAKAGLKVRKLYDGNGLLLRIAPNGTKSWEFKFRIPGADGKPKEKTLSLGVYPEIGLKEARDKCIEARKLRRDGKDPAEERRLQKQQARYEAANTFKAVAEEWLKANKDRWCESHKDRTWRRVELHLLPVFGQRSIASITALDILDELQKLEGQNKTETSHRLLQICRGVFQTAVITKRAPYNPTYDLKGALRAHRGTSYPSFGHNQLPEFFERLEGGKLSEMTRLAIKFLALTFVRQGELRQTKWTDINLTEKEWRVRAETTKMRQLHIVPLSPQAITILSIIKKMGNQSEFVFPAQNRTKHPIMSENTINKALRDLGYEGQMVGHGFRSLASTILNEKGFRGEVIERQLAHMPRDKVRAVYNRAQYLPERRELMNWWGNHLEQAGMQICSNKLAATALR